VESPLPQTERFPLDQDLRVPGQRDALIHSLTQHWLFSTSRKRQTPTRQAYRITSLDKGRTAILLGHTRTRPAPTSAHFNLPAMFRSTLIAAATLAACAFAVPQITIPAAGASIPAGPITVTWTDDGKAPKLTLLKSATLQLIVGGNGATDNVCGTAYHQNCPRCDRRGCLE
jgi:hypothetical protein